MPNQFSLPKSPMRKQASVSPRVQAVQRRLKSVQPPKPPTPQVKKPTFQVTM